MHLFQCTNFSNTYNYFCKCADCIENTFNLAIKNNYRFSIGSKYDIIISASCITLIQPRVLCSKL